MSSTEWFEVFRTGNETEAAIIKGLLESNGFPVQVESRGLKALSFYLGATAPGDLVLLVPPDQAEAALDLLDASAPQSAPPSDPAADPPADEP